MVRIRSTAKPRHGLLVDLSKVVLETCLSVFLLVVPSIRGLLVAIIVLPNYLTMDKNFFSSSVHLSDILNNGRPIQNLARF